MQDREYLDSLQNFYEEMKSKQVPLESEFADILYENLWELYESDDTDDETNQKGVE